MKVIQSIEYFYEEQKPINEKLKVKVDEIFGRISKRTWHYFSRLKELESYALKIETGRAAHPRKLEDFFACTLVVENLDQINNAISLIEEYFEIEYRRPKDSKVTHKKASSFEFDDLRLYAKLKVPGNMPEQPLAEILFEIQIKTFLQHAWGLATHDLIYKTDDINWAKERIAYQIKATLEQAEVTISGVNKLIELAEVSKESYDTIELKKILKFYTDLFSSEDLPKDLVRLCNNTQGLLIELRLSVDDLRLVFDNETSVGRGSNLKNLSPYLLIIQSLINQKKAIIENLINGHRKPKHRLIIPRELDISSLSITHGNNVVMKELA